MLPLLVQQRPTLPERTVSKPLTMEEVYRLHAPTVIRWALRLGGPSFELEDVVQDVFLKVHRSLASFRGEAKITTWLYQITRNVVGHRRRKDRIRRWLRGSADEVAGHLPALGITPVEAIERQEASRQLYRALDALSERHRTVFILFEMEQLSGEEIAEVMEAKVETVWVWLHRARAQYLKQVARLKAEESL